MSILYIMSGLALLEGAKETAKYCYSKAKDYATQRRFKRKLRAKRKGRRQFV